MIDVDSLELKQGDFSLSDVSFSVGDGAYAILMGETGAGKTSLLEVICGLRMARSGCITIDGRDITALDPGQRNIGYVPQDSVLFPTMRVDRQSSKSFWF